MLIKAGIQKSYNPKMTKKIEYQHESYNEVQPKAKFKSGKTQNQKHTMGRNRKTLEGTWDTGVL